MVVIEPMERESRTAFKERKDTIDKVNEIIDYINNGNVDPEPTIPTVEKINCTVTGGYIILPLSNFKSGIYNIRLYQGTFTLIITENMIDNSEYPISNVCLTTGSQGVVPSFYMLGTSVNNDDLRFSLQEKSVTDLTQPYNRLEISVETVDVYRLLTNEGD